MNKKFAAVLFSASCLTLAVIACNDSKTVSGPDTTTTTTTTSTSTPTATAPAPQPVTPTPDPNPRSVDAWIGNGGSFYAKNLADAPAHFVFYTTSFDKQTYTAGDPKKEATVKNGDVFQDTFDTTCRQIDGAFNSTDGYIFVAAFVDKQGKVFNPSNNPEKVTECRKGCDPTWEVTGEPSYSEWSDSAAAGSTVSYCHKAQTRTKTVREKNSCNGEFRSTTTTETRTIEGSLYSRIRYTSDPSQPSSGNSFFDYHLFRIVGTEDAIPGIALTNPDQSVFSQKLAKNTSVLINVSPDGSKYYGFYDAEIGSRTYVTASCNIVTPEWHISLKYECGCSYQNLQ